MIRLKMKNYNIILTEKLQKYQPYHQEKPINTNIAFRLSLFIHNLERLLKNK